jgi:site-specific DNA-cytosine methylase
MKWATMIPLVGGSAIGCAEATGIKPEYHLSYSAFADNEKHLTNYWQDIPLIQLDKEENRDKTKLDFINSVCPCAGLSMLATNRDESKNDWMLNTANLVLSELKPRVFWGENAPGLYTGVGESVRTSLMKIAQANGYSFSLYRTSTSMHGIPQQRTRSFYFFWDSLHAPVLNYYNRPRQSFTDYIQTIPSEASMQSGESIKDIFVHSPIYKYVLERYQMNHQEFVQRFGDGVDRSLHWHLLRADGTGWTSSQRNKTEKNFGILDDSIAWLEKYHADHKELRTLKHIKNKVSAGLNFMSDSPVFYKDITTAMVGRLLSQAIHPIFERSLNHREIMHMMGMPSDFELTNNKINHVAQNVPVPTARDMATEVMEYLNNNRESSGHSWIFQNNLSGKIDSTGDY